MSELLGGHRNLKPRTTRLGRVDYATTFAAMREFTARRDHTTPDELWIVEHPPVYTLGLAGRREHLLAPGAIPVQASDRGGQVTYHGPGQIVVYVLADLRRQRLYVRELVYRIEQAVIQTLAQLGVDGRRVTGAPGIYVAWRPGATDPVDAHLIAAAAKATAPDFSGLAKIAALGIKVTKGCCYHGVALNVAMDLTPFARIDPCGYTGLATIDLATLGVTVSVDSVGDLLADRLSAHLSLPASREPSEPALAAR